MSSEGDAGVREVRLIAIHNFAAEQKQALELVKGQLVIGNHLEDEWWVGLDPASGKQGVFPANFVADEGSEAAWCGSLGPSSTPSRKLARSLLPGSCD